MKRTESYSKETLVLTLLQVRVLIPLITLALLVDRNRRRRRSTFSAALLFEPEGYRRWMASMRPRAGMQSSDLDAFLAVGNYKPI